MYVRRISYRRGAEGSFARLPASQLWMNLEVLPNFCIPRFAVGLARAPHITGNPAIDYRWRGLWRMHTISTIHSLPVLDPRVPWLGREFTQVLTSYRYSLTILSAEFKICACY
jgi:hypothetical protein